MSIVSIFSQSMACLFTLMVSYEEQTSVILIKSSFLFFLLWFVILASHLRNVFLIQGCEDVCLCFPLQVLSLTYIAVSHFKISFMYGEKQGSNFILLFLDIQLLKHKRKFFPPLQYLSTWSKINCYIVRSLGFDITANIFSA